MGVTGGENAKSRVRSAVIAAIAVFVILSVLFAASMVKRTWFTQDHVRTRSEAATAADIDLSTILASNAAKPTFASTFGWWTNTWSGTRIYWRPLSSQLFWLEQRAFSSTRFDLWYACEIGFHLLATALLGWLTLLLTRRRSMALLATFLFAGWRPLALSSLAIGFPLLDFNVPAFVSLQSWKDSVDVWVTICLLGSLICAEKNNWLGCIIICFFASALKESGVLNFAVTGAYIACRGHLRAVPVWVYSTIFAAILLLVGLRLLAQHLSGNQLLIPVRDHSNRAWPSRFSYAIDGTFGASLFSITWANAVAGFFIGLALFCKGLNLPIRLLAAVSGILLTVSLQALISHSSLVVDAVLLLDPSCALKYVISLAIFSFAFLATLVSTRSRSDMLASYVLIVLTAIPTATILQPNMHMFYGVYAFQSIFTAILIVSAADYVGKGFARPSEALDHSHSAMLKSSGGLTM